MVRPRQPSRNCRLSRRALYPRCVHIQRVDTIASTSLALRQQIAEGSLTAQTALVALEQSGGIGQFGRRWFSPRGGLWFTIASPLPLAQGSRALSDYVSGDATRSPLGARLGEACRNALAAFLAGERHNADLRLKPPNDLLIASPTHPQGAKVAGLLTEIVTPTRPAAPWLLVGIGINTNIPADLLPTGLAYPATSLLIELHRPISNDALLDALLNAMHTATV